MSDETRTLQHKPCGFKWRPRVDQPVQCPSCHRPIDFEDDVRTGRLTVETE